MTTETAQIRELTTEGVSQAVDAIVGALGNPENELHVSALAAFRSGDYQVVKRLASTNLSDRYVKSLGYLGGALKLTPNTDTILAEAARAAAAFVEEKTLSRLGDAIAKALN